MPTQSRLVRRLTACLMAAGLAFTASMAAAQETVRVALRDSTSRENLAFLVALERAKERGLSYQLTSFSGEDLATQAVIGGHADIGVGIPYKAIQENQAPLRIIFRLSALVFYPVVSNEYKSWRDLDGKPVTFDSRGGTVEIIGDVIARREGIAFGERSYVPQAADRAVALLNGTSTATILDRSNTDIVMEQADKRFHVLSTPGDRTSAETLFADKDWLDSHRDDASLLVQELLGVWREMNANPAIITEERAARNLNVEESGTRQSVTSFYAEAVSEGVYPPGGGSEAAALADFAFYTAAGELSGAAADLTVEDFWDFGPLQGDSEEPDGN